VSLSNVDPHVLALVATRGMRPIAGRCLAVVVAVGILLGACAEQAPRESQVHHDVIASGHVRGPCASSGASGQCNDMYIVAHQDDDLLFINPDVKKSIDAGNNVMVVYLTAGQNDAACGSWDAASSELYWTNRERGILHAYEVMSGTPTAPWSATTLSIPLATQKQVAWYQRSGTLGQTVTVAFFRLADFTLEGTWNGTGSSPRLVCQSCPRFETTLGPDSFTRAEIVASLQYLMTSFPDQEQADSVSTTDATALYWSMMGGPHVGDPFDDFGSHVAAANFALAALVKQQAASNTTKHFRTYRGYSAPQEYENLSSVEHDAKASHFMNYATWDCVQNKWYQANLPDRVCAANTTTTLCGSDNQPAPMQCSNGVCTEQGVPLFDWHWGRTYSERSLVGSGDLQGRLAMRSSSGAMGCLSVGGATALSRTAAVASSGSGGTGPAKAIDTNLGSKWVSDASDTQSIYVDLGSSKYVTRVRFTWDTNYARSYEIQISDNAQTWTRVYGTTSGGGGTQTVTLPPNSAGRYVKLSATQRALTTSGYALFDFGIDTFTSISTSYNCSTAPAWLVTSLQQIKLLGTSSCLQAAGVGTVTIGSCTSNRENSTFFLMSNGQILSNPTGTFDSPEVSPAMCLAGSDTNGGAITKAGCRKKCVDESTGVEIECSASHPPDQNGQCNGATEIKLDGTCYPRPAGRPTNNQNWTLLFDTPTLRTTQFDDTTEIDSAPYYYRSFSIAERNVCVRRSWGVDCAPSNGSTIGPAAPLTSGFSDASGWNADPNGSTVAAVWDPVLGQKIACGRGYYGAGCTTAGTSSFSNAEGWADYAFYYNSIRYADVNGDGKPDICGRGYWGVSCALNQTSSFTTAALWTTNFSANDNWNQVGVGDTIQFGDVNGDGRTDVCGRHLYGLDCAVGTNSAFNNYKPWSFDNDRRYGDAVVFGINRDFANTDIFNWHSSAAYYGSVRLVDINRDGFADACGRGPGGIYCAFSVGNGFDAKRLVLPEDFTDPGWSPPDKGSTISFGDLDGDSRVDVCGRGYWGVVCGEGY
jgi:hypothetical protein